MNNMNELYIQPMVFSAEVEELRKAVIDNAVEVGCVAGSQMDNGRGMIGHFSMSNYNEANRVAKDGVLAFACSQSGVPMPKTNTEVAHAFENTQFRDIFNSIQRDVIMGIMVRAQSPQIMAMANVETVDMGASYTWEIDSKGLPIAQRASIMNNVTIDQTQGIKSITLVPKPYSMGVTMDFTRIVANDYDFGKQLAKVALGMLYAQYKLIVGLIFNTASTPINQLTFDQLKYTTMADDLEALNGSSVTAFASKVALSKLGATISTNGFLLKDEFIKEGYIGSPFGVPTVMVNQATDFSAPLVGAELASRLIPNDKMVLLSGVGDKPVKLVRENYIRVIQQTNLAGATNKMRYSYFMSFEAGIATQQHFGVQVV